MSMITIVKSTVRFLPLTMYVMLSTLAVRPETSMAQALSHVNCREIVIFGAVKTPGRFETQARMHLVEVLKRVGGPSERAGKVVQVIHFCNCLPCPEGEVKAPASSEFNLSAVLEGKKDANPDVMAGDIVIVPEAELIFVVGNVLSQKSLVFREGVTLTQAIATAGGVAKHSELVRIRIHRNPANGLRSTLLNFSLKAVLDNRSQDPMLQPQDIIEISDETGKFSPPLTPPQFDPPLMDPTGDPPLSQRKSSNCL